MIKDLFVEESIGSIPIYPVIEANFADFIKDLPAETQQWFEVNHFKAESGAVCFMPNSSGHLSCAYVGMCNNHDYWALGALPLKLPEGTYQIAGDWDESFFFLMIMAWGLGAYQFDQYHSCDPILSKLVLPEDFNQKKLLDMLESFFLARDLINTPAEDLRPQDYAEVVKKLAHECGAKIQVIDGKPLKNDYPAVYAVGRAGEQPPALIDMTWGADSDVKLTLIGKGVCFDSGGLDIKSASGMRGMKADMGGSAIVLAMARLIIQQALPVRLRLIIPMVENAVSGNSTRPGDVIRMRSGKTVEVGNTDAEGRLILADALALACEDAPDYLIDVATLTGAARIAMGPDVPAFFSNDAELASALMESSQAQHETISRLPLYAPYKKFLKSDLADLNNISSTVYGGAITAALFLQAFVGKGISWAHFDVMAMNTRHLSGRPKGGEAQGLLTLYHWIEQLVNNPVD